MIRRAIPFAALLLLAGSCPVVHRQISFERSEELVRQGRLVEALDEFERIAKSLLSLQSRDASEEDALAYLYRRLFEIKAGEYAADHPEILPRCPSLAAALADRAGGSALTLSMSHDIALLTGAAPPQSRSNSLTRVAETLLFKARDSSLRKSELEDSSSLHRLLILESAAAFEHAYLRGVPTADKTRLKTIFERLAVAADELAASPKALGEFKKAWKQSADDYRDRAIGAIKDPSPAPLPDEIAKISDYSVTRDLQEGIDWADRGTRIRTERGPKAEIDRCYRAALRQMVLARECILAPSVREVNSLCNIPIVLKLWRDTVEAE